MVAEAQIESRIHNCRGMQPLCPGETWSEPIGRFIRLKVTNSGIDSAQTCHGYLTGVQQIREGIPHPTLHDDTLTLHWSSTPGGAGLTLPRAVPFYLNVFKVYKSVTPELCIVHGPAHSMGLFDKEGSFLLTVMIVAANAAAITVQLRFEWNGDWERFTVVKV